jgi:hypothetical protein
MKIIKFLFIIFSAIKNYREMTITLNFANTKIQNTNQTLPSENNGRESAINRALDGSTYASLKLVPSSLCKNF